MHKYILLFPVVNPEGDNSYLRLSVMSEKKLCRRRLWRGFRNVLKVDYRVHVKKEAMRTQLKILHTDNFYVSPERIEEFIRNISDDAEPIENIPDTGDQSSDTQEAEVPVPSVSEGFTNTPTS